MQRCRLETMLLKTNVASDVGREATRRSSTAVVRRPPTMNFLRPSASLSRPSIGPDKNSASAPALAILPIIVAAEAMPPLRPLLLPRARSRIEFFAVPKSVVETMPAKKTFDTVLMYRFVFVLSSSLDMVDMDMTY